MNPKLKTPNADASEVKNLADLDNAQDILDSVARVLSEREIDVALLGGKKYMVNNCLGIKASAGKFRLRPDNPHARTEGSGVVMKFSIDRIYLEALKIRMKPNASNPLEPCKFSKRFKVSGSASDVSLKITIPTLEINTATCRVKTFDDLEMKWKVGGLNLKPLQNDLDKVAKEMIEASLNAASAAVYTGGTLSGFLNAQLEARSACGA
ncbi:MAG: hypothetical protein ACOYXU_14840 [Nitrospirota bacterium]